MVELWVATMAGSHQGAHTHTDLSWRAVLPLQDQHPFYVGVLLRTTHLGNGIVQE